MFYPKNKSHEIDLASDVTFKKEHTTSHLYHFLVKELWKKKKQAQY